MALVCVLVASTALAEHKLVKVPSDADVTIAWGGEVSELGDVNGDGAADFALSYCSAGRGAGDVFVGFGPLGDKKRQPLELLDGFHIEGPRRRFYACNTVGPGDVNGDGLADVLVGATGSNRRGLDSGTAYVVFGKNSTTPVQLQDFNRDAQGNEGFRIEGSGELAQVGGFVTDPGDVNGDGLDDVALGSPWYGSGYVVFGKGTTETVELALFEMGLQNTSGYRIDVPVPYSTSEFSIAGAGDVNADGQRDVVIGVIRSSQQGTYRGNAYITWGKSDPLAIDTRSGSAWGFRVRGERRSGTGSDVATAGDANTDGFDDVAIGSAATGRVTVVFGGNDPEDLALGRLGERGFKVEHVIRRRDPDSLTVEPGGDLNGDGRDDVLIGSAAAGQNQSGSVFVIFSPLKLNPIDVRTLGPHGWRIDGEARGGWLEDATAPGDIAADGCDDILLGASRLSKSYVLTGCILRE